MSHLQVTIPVRAPSDRVWRALTDWDSQSGWMLATTVRSVGPQRRGAGDRIEAFTGVGPVGFLDTMVVTGWTEGTEVTVRHTGRVVRGHGTFRVEPVDDDASVVVWIESLQVPGGRLGSLAWALVKPVNQWAVRHSLRNFARQLEVQQTVRA